MTAERAERAEAALPRPHRPPRERPPIAEDAERAEAAVLRPHRPSREAPTSTPDAWKAIGRLATRQGGFVHRSQLRGAGLQRPAVRHAVAAGRLFPRAEVFLVGHESPAVDADLHRALLLAGADPVLSHRTAAWVWGVAPRPQEHEVTVPSNRRARRRLRLHRAALHPRRDVTWRRGLPITSLLRTVLDCAAVMDEAELGRLINQVAIKGWLHDRNVAALLHMVRGRRGARALRRVLEARDRSKGWTRSSLEAFFAEVAQEAGLPAHQRGVLVDIGGGDLRECDVVWPELRVMVELDYLPIHESGLTPYRDRRRDRRLAAAGWTVIRLTPEDLTHHRDEVVADLRRALGIAE